MIEFNGYISGVTEKYFWKKTRQFGLSIIFATFLLFLPMIVNFFRYSHDSFVGKLICLSFILLFLMPYIPKSKKTKLSLITKKICIDEEYIVCTSDKSVESKLISDVKKVYDYGDFYYLTFPFGKISTSFVCQKDLLIKGTLEDFESLFEGKIEIK